MCSLGVRDGACFCSPRHFVPDCARVPQATENGELIIALDPGRFFGEPEAFADRVESLLAAVGGRLPGERRLENRASASRSGLTDVDQSLWTSVNGLMASQPHLP